LNSPIKEAAFEIDIEDTKVTEARLFDIDIEG
jgi:hypothetical protein